MEATDLIRSMRLISTLNDNVQDNVIVNELTACICNSEIDKQLLQKCGFLDSFVLLCGAVVEAAKINYSKAYKIESVPHDSVYYFRNKPSVFRNNVLSAIPMMSEPNKKALDDALSNALHYTSFFVSIETTNNTTGTSHSEGE